MFDQLIGSNVLQVNFTSTTHEGLRRSSYDLVGLPFSGNAMLIFNHELLLLVTRFNINTGH